MSLAGSLITVDYFRYHIDDMGEQKETEWSCHDYSDFFSPFFLKFLIFVLHLKIFLSLNF